MLRSVSLIYCKYSANKSYVFAFSRSFSLSVTSFVRGTKDPTLTLAPFGEIEGSVSNVHLNPALHRQLMESPVEKCKESKLLKVCVLGVPNVGKSTLVNRLVEANACPFSQKAHTTRKASRAIMTVNNVQIVFCDTPGVVKPDDVKKFHLENSLVHDPFDSAKSADLIIVLQDVSNRYTREAIDKGILKLLCFHAHNVPSVLVLNKVDTLNKNKNSFYRIIDKLTCGYLDGKKQATKQVLSQNVKPTKVNLDSYLKRKLKEHKKVTASKEEENSPVDAKVVKITSYDDFLHILNTETLSHSLVTQLTNGLVGWPGFKEVFAVSALHGNGVDDLRNYLLSLAKESPWAFHPQLLSDVCPPDFVTSVVKSKCLEVLSGREPYAMKPEIASWKVENGTLRLNIQLEVNSTTMGLLLKSNSYNLKLIAQLSERDLQNFFSCEVFLLISLHNPSASHQLSSDKKDQKKKKMMVMANKSDNDPLFC